MLIQKQKTEKKSVGNTTRESSGKKKVTATHFYSYLLQERNLEKKIYKCTCNEIHATELLQKQKQRKPESSTVLAVKAHKVSGQMSKQ